MKTVIPVVLLLIAACGDEPREPEAPPEAGVFDELTGTIDRAEAVEEQVLEQKERLDRALDDAEGEPESRPR